MPLWPLINNPQSSKGMLADAEIKASLRVGHFGRLLEYEQREGEEGSEQHNTVGSLFLFGRRS